MIDESSTVGVEYFIDFYEGESSLWYGMKVIFIVFCIVSFAITLIRLYFWYTHNKFDWLQDKFAKQITLYFFYYLFDVWSFLMFWVCFFTTGYWFIYYKMQNNANILLPSIELFSYAYNFFNAFFYVILATKTLAVLLKVLIQASTEIIIMDWEPLQESINSVP